MDIDNVTGLALRNRQIGESALQKLFHTENCAVVKLSELRLDNAVKQAVGMVIFGRGRSRPAVSARESGALYFISDLKGNTGSLELFYDAKQKFRGVASITELAGTIVYLINPKVMSDPQRPETLLFQVSRQQDIVVIGKSCTFSLCDGIRKDGKSCTMPVDTSDSSRCKYHKERQHSDVSEMRKAVSAVPVRSAPIPSKSSSHLPSEVASTSPVDFLQQALQPDGVPNTNRSGAPHAPLVGKVSSISPQVDDDDEEDVHVSLETRANNAAEEFGPGRKKALVTGSSASIESRKDGSVSIPKESGVFKTLSDIYYNNRAKENKARATAIALQQTASSSRPPPQASGKAGPGRTSNGLLSSRHTGVTRHNSLLAQNQKRKLEQSVVDKINHFSKLRCVGGDLFDLDQARKNANKPNQKKVAELKSVQVVKQKQLDVDIEALLNRESSHVLEAEDDAFKSQMSRLETLSKREYMAQKDEKVHSLSVRAYHCMSCNEMSESPLQKCRNQGHVVNTISVVKRFYECVNCEHRVSTLGGSVRLPTLACLRCNEYKWRPCGKRKTGLETSSRVTAADKLVVRMAEGTARGDIDRVAGAKSTLDHLK